MKTKIKITIGVIIYFFIFIFITIFMRVPENKYEWMLKEDHSLTYEKLPEDPDTIMRKMIFSIPIIISASINLIYSFAVFKKKGRILSLGFSVLLLILIIAKFTVIIT